MLIDYRQRAGEVIANRAESGCIIFDKKVAITVQTEHLVSVLHNFNRVSFHGFALIECGSVSVIDFCKRFGIHRHTAFSLAESSLTRRMPSAGAMPEYLDAAPHGLD